MAEIPIFSPLVTHVPEVGKTSKFFWYILRWTRHHKKIFKFLGQKGSEICKVKYRDFEIFSYILHPIFVGWQARSGDLSRLKSSGQPDHIIGILQISNHDDDHDILQ